MFNLFKKTIESKVSISAIKLELAFQNPMLDIRPQWKKLSADKKIQASDMAALCIYRSYVKGEGKEGAISRLKKSFYPITNTVKLENGAAPNGALLSALWTIRNSTFISWLPETDAKYLIEIGKEIYREWK